MITSSTSLASTFDLFNKSLITIAPNSEAFNLESAPLKEPSGRNT